MTVLVMPLILAFLGILLLPGDQRGKQASFFNREATGTLRGFWSLVILLVHVPSGYQNGIQDLLGSFGYIGVTFFFMTSGYGLFLAMERDGNYLRHFWRNRLMKLLPPMLLANVLSVAVSIYTGQAWDIWDLLAVTGWVRQLLIFYAVFWLIYRIFPGRKDGLFYGAVLALSFVAYIGNGRLLRWPVESLGFLYGALLYRYRDVFCRIASKHWVGKLVIACAAALLTGVGYIWLKHCPFWGDYLLRIVLGIAILLVLLIWNVKVPVGNAPGRFLGRISYEIYLLHDGVFRLLDALPVRWESGIYVGVSMVVTVGVSLIVHGICSRKGGLVAWVRN